MAGLAGGGGGGGGRGVSGILKESSKKHSAEDQEYPGSIPHRLYFSLREFGFMGTCAEALSSEISKTLNLARTAASLKAQSLWR